MKSVFPYTGLLESVTVLRLLDPNDKMENYGSCVLLHQCELPFPSCRAGFLHPLLGPDPCSEEGKTGWVWEANEASFRSMAFAGSTASIQRSNVKNP